MKIFGLCVLDQETTTNATDAGSKDSCKNYDSTNKLEQTKDSV